MFRKCLCAKGLTYVSAHNYDSIVVLFLAFLFYSKVYSNFNSKVLRKNIHSNN